MDFKPFKIGKYLLLERLATGGMAEVYRAKASGAGGFEKQLAIKRILPSYSQNDEFRRMFEYEARLSSMLTHANIVQVYDFVKSGETYLLAMEYVDGKNLRQFVNKGKKVGIAPPPVEFGVYVINEVAKGLDYAHKKKDDLTGKPLNIIHRDMSPQNIMLAYEGAVKIVDFGIAKAKDRVDETRSGVIKGKFGYMSPEQANGEPVDHRTDIFSTGIILFELLTGKRLFAAESDMATLRQIQECVIPQPSRINPKISAELEKILLKALSKDIKMRFQNAGLFHRALLEYLNKHHPSYTQKECSDLLQKVFAEEIENEKKRFEQLYRQSIPFSQGAQKTPSDELEGVEEALEGSITKSEAGNNTAVTFADEMEGSGEVSESPAPEVAPESSEADGQGLSLQEPSEEPAPESEPELEISSGGDTQVESLIEDDEPEPSAPAAEAREKTKVSGNFDIELSQPGDPSVTKEKTKNPATPTLGRIRPTVPPEEKENSITPTPTKAAILRPLGAKVDGRGRPVNPRARKPAGEAVPTTGIELGEANEGTRRGNRTASLNDMDPGTRFQRSPGLSLPLEEKNPFGSPSGTIDGAPRKPYYPEREDELFERKRALLSGPVKLILVICLVAVGYKLWFEGQVPVVVGMFNPRDTTSSPSRGTHRQDSDPAPSDKKPIGDCTVEVSTDPAGAEVLMGQTSLGASTATVSGKCGSAVDITMKLDGYETITKNVVLHQATERLYTTLKRIPMGTLELTVNNNAKVYLDGQYIGDATAHVKFERSLRANQKYTLALVNDILRLQASAQISINENEVLEKAIDMEQTAPPPKTNRRAMRSRAGNSP